MTLFLIIDKVMGRMLVIEQTEDLNKLFMKDPSPGKRKKLRIDYVTRGVTGNLRVRVADDKLVASIGKYTRLLM